ncbi:regulatory protein RecX [Marinobacteraceae bacterium S3BR75-40.1]
MVDDAHRQASGVALKLLARREHSRRELALKLMQRHFEDAVIEAVLDEFESRQWLDDERFAEVYVRQRVSLGYGPMRIMAELQQRGVDGEPEALKEVDGQTWCQMAREAREKKFGLQPIEDRRERGRQGRYLAQRGYTMSQIEAALGVEID